MSAAVNTVDRYNEDSASPLTINKPALTSPGNLLIVIIVQHGAPGHLGDMTAPDATWTEQGNWNGTNSQAKVFSHVVTGGDPATWDFPYYVNGDTCLFCFDITGADTTPTVVVTSTNTTSLTSSYDSPTVTPTGTDDLLIVAIGDISNGTTFSVTIPSGTTTAGTTQVAGGFMAVGGASQQLTSGSATGAKTWTSVTPTGADGGSFSIAIKSAASATAGSVNQRIPNWLIYQIAKARLATSAPPASIDQTVTPSGVTTAEAVGAATVTATNTIATFGIVSTEVMGSPTVTATNTIAPSGIVSAEAIGSPTLTATATISPSGIISSEAVGAATVTANITVSGIISSEAFGSPTITATATITPSGIISTERFGGPTTALNVTPSGIVGAEQVGSPTLTVFTGINPNGIVSAEQVGSPTILSTVTVAANGIRSSEIFGVPTIQATNQIFASGIVSSELPGSPALTAGPVTVTAHGIVSGEAFGRTQVSIGLIPQTIVAHGIESAEKIGFSFIGREMPVHVGALVGSNTVIAKVSTVVVAHDQGINVDAEV